MHKYAISKINYICLVAILLFLSVGYTYAYFSARADANGNVTLGKINVLWKDYSADRYIDSNWFDDVQEIAIAPEIKLTRGNYETIKATTQSGSFVNLTLAISNDTATVGAYCRIRIVAKYIPQGETTPIDCLPGTVQLAFNSQTITNVQLNDVTGESYETGWFEENGCYYYGSASKDEDGNIVSKTFSVLAAGETKQIANQLYLAHDADMDIMGSTMYITVALEGVQATNNAYKAVWGVDW